MTCSRIIQYCCLCDAPQQEVRTSANVRSTVKFRENLAIFEIINVCCISYISYYLRI